MRHWLFLPRSEIIVFQTIQKEFIHIAIPVLKVMKKMHEAQDDMASLNAKELITDMCN